MLNKNIKRTNTRKLAAIICVNILCTTTLVFNASAQGISKASINPDVSTTQIVANEGLDLDSINKMIDRAQASVEIETTQKIETDVDEYASFPGGPDANVKWLQNVFFPTVSEKTKIPSRYDIKFMVTNMGTIKIMRISTIPPGQIEFMKEATNVWESMPKWTPAKKNGKSVNISQDVSFGLGNSRE